MKTSSRKASGLSWRFLGWMIVSVIVAGSVASFERRYYLSILAQHGVPANTVERRVAFLLLAGKSLIVLTPWLVGCALLAWSGRRRGADIAFLSGVFGLTLGLLADVTIRRATGNSLAFYLSFAANPRQWVYGGVGGGLAAGWLPYGALLVAGLAAGQCLVHTACKRTLRGQSPRTIGAALGVGAVGFAACLVAPALAHAWTRGSVAIDVLHAQLPLNTYEFALTPADDAASLPFRLIVEREVKHPYDEWRANLKVGPTPADLQIAPGKRPPHIVLIVLESLRPEALRAENMPRVTAWAENGLRLDRHHSLSNCSHMGMFSLLFARPPLHYGETLDVGHAAPVCATLGRAGYERSFLSAVSVQWERMNDFIHPTNFDRIETCENPWSALDFNNWIAGDRVALRRARQLLQSEKPQFVVVFLMASHLPYACPPEYERHRPVPPGRSLMESFLSKRLTDREAVRRRYRNALAFLDDEVADFVAELDPARHLVGLTGDHGESFQDDGVWIHSSRPSDAQVRVPCVLLGDGLPKRTMDAITTHADIAPTLFAAIAGSAATPTRVPGSPGRDLLHEPAPNQALVVCHVDGVHQIVLIRDDLRVGVHVKAAPQQMSVEGVYGENGLRQHDRPLPRDLARSVAESLANELRRMSR